MSAKRVPARLSQRLFILLLRSNWGICARGCFPKEQIEHCRAEFFGGKGFCQAAVGADALGFSQAGWFFGCGDSQDLGVAPGWYLSNLLTGVWIDPRHEQIQNHQVRLGFYNFSAGSEAVRSSVDMPVPADISQNVGDLIYDGLVVGND